MILLKALDSQHIGTGLQKYTFNKSPLTGDMKATFNQATLNIGKHTVDDFNKVLMNMTKHTFLTYTFCRQKRNL